MKITIGGSDATAALAGALAPHGGARAEAVRREAVRQAPILELREAPDEVAFLRHWLRLLRSYGAAWTRDFDIPARPGVAGRAATFVKRLLWKVLRYQHERMAYQHNQVHAQLVQLAEAELETSRRELAQLARRVEALERAARPGRGEGGRA